MDIKLEDHGIEFTFELPKGSVVISVAMTRFETFILASHESKKDSGVCNSRYAFW
jgi:hypothetical protein